MDRIRQAFSGRNDFFFLRIVGGGTAAGLAVICLAIEGFNDAFLLLAGLAAIVLTFPWHRLSALRAGPFEFSLERGQIKGAIDSIEIGGGYRTRINEVLSRYTVEVDRARGSRVLWVDDKPRRLIAERRLLRAIEIDTVLVPTCREAALTLMRDNDFDLLITSLEKRAERELMPGDSRSPAVAFAQWLRGQDDGGIRGLLGPDVEVPISDEVINRLPIVIYAAFPSLAYIRQRIQPLVGLEPAVEAARTLDDLLKKTVRSLADQRFDPIEISSEKKIFAQ